MSGYKIENQSIIYRTARFHEARVKWSVLDKSDPVLREKDINIDPGLDKFGMNLEDLQHANFFQG